jgi:hypothetical protein
MTWRTRTAELTLLMMESLALFVLGDLLAGLRLASGPSIIAVFLASLGGFWLSRLLDQIDLPARPLIAIGVVLALLAIWVIGLAQYGSTGGLLLVNRGWPQLLGVVVLGAAWLRASVNARRALTYPFVLRSFTTGLAVIVVGLLLGRGAVSSRAIDEAALPFFVAGLVSLAFVHLSQSEHIRGDTWRGPWALVVGGTTLVLALVGGVAGLLPLTAFNRVLGPAVGFALLALDLVIYAIALPSALVFNWLLSILLGGHHPKAQVDPSVATNAAKSIQAKAHHSALAAISLFVIKLLLIAVVVAAILGLVYWVYRRREHARSDTEEERESIWAEGSLRDELGALLSSLRARFQRAPGPPEPALPARILAVRRLYLRLLERGASVGAARPPATTAEEFAPVLADRFHSPAPRALSQRFSDARYGLVEPSDAELEALERELRSITEGR